MEFRILGPLEVYEDGRRVDLGGARQRALLAILLTRANHVVSRDRLIDDLFGEEPRGSAGALLQVYISRLRKALEPGRKRRQQTGVVVTKAPGYLVRVGPDELDLWRFERLTEEGRQALAASSPELARERLVDALALWRGPRSPTSRSSRSHRARPAASRSSGWQRSRIASTRTWRSVATIRSSASSSR